MILEAPAFGLFGDIVPALYYIFAFLKKKAKDAVSIRARDQDLVFLQSFSVTIQFRLKVN